MRQARPFPVLALALAMVMSLFPMIPTVAQDDDVTCADFDAWPWAQTILESDPDRYAGALDPDSNGVACEDLTIHGFAPVLWADRIPDGVEAAQVVSVTDGDTFKVSVNGQVDTVRMYHIDTPETTNFGGGLQCGGHEASDYLTYVLSLAPNGTVYLEYDETQRDRFDRRLAYVWFQYGDDVYMVNEVLVRNGWAESETYEPDTKYKEQLDAAEQFSVQKVNGVRLLCGRFGQPADGTAAPSGQQLREAQQRQPDQGQFVGIVSREAREQQAQAQPTEAPAPPPAAAPAQPSGNCDPAYPDVCIPPVSVAGDLNCKDISFRRFRVLPPDPHNFDGDFDGVGCES